MDRFVINGPEDGDVKGLEVKGGDQVRVSFTERWDPRGGSGMR